MPYKQRNIRNFLPKRIFTIPNIYVKFEPEYQTRIRISIENRPIELCDSEVKKFLSQYTIIEGKTYYPGIRHKNKYYTTGTRVYQCVKINKHIPRHLYKFGRYLRIWYDSQPTNSSNTQHIITNNTQNTPIPTNHETPTLSQPQPNVTKRHKKTHNKTITKTQQTINNNLTIFMQHHKT